MIEIEFEDHRLSVLTTLVNTYIFLLQNIFMIFSVVGVAYDKSQTFRRGAAKFPELFWSLIEKAETFHYGIELSEMAFFDNLGIIKPKNFQELVDAVEKKLRIGKGFPVVIGGEHSVTVISAKTLKELGKVEKLVVFDAHPDCDVAPEHASIVRRLLPVFGAENIFLFGVRCFSKREKEFVEKQGIKILHNEKELEKINGKVYLSIDFDVINPAEMPCVGNPEPCGISASEFLSAVKVLAPKLCAVDFVEITPLKYGECVYEYVAVNLILKVLAIILTSRI